MKLTMNKNQTMNLALAMIVAYGALLVPSDALAGSNNILGQSGDNPISGVLCEVVSWFTGAVGQGIATLAIIVIGIGALMGKVSWGMAIIVGIGVAVVFGAPRIVEILSGGNGESCATTFGFNNYFLFT